MKAIINDEDFMTEILICKDEKRALSVYGEIEFNLENPKIELEIDNLDRVVYEIPEDLSTIDIP